MPELHLSLDLHIVLVDHSLKRKKRIIKKIGDSKCIFQNELDKPCCQLDMAYGNFKNLNRRTFADNVLRVKLLILLKIQ